MGDTSDLQQALRVLSVQFEQQLGSILQQLQAGQEAGDRMRQELHDTTVTAAQAARAAQQAALTADAAHALAQSQPMLGQQAELNVQRNAMSKRTLTPKSPEEFDPAKKKDVDTWLFQVEVYYQLYPNDTDTAKIIDCSSYFRGGALVWWRHFAATHNLEAMTWTQFREAIRERWQVTNVVRAARDKIATIRQLTSVQDYTHRFLDLKVQIPGMTNEEAVDRYVRGLKPTIRRDVEQLMSRESDKTLEELIRFADRTDSVDYQARRYRPAGPTPMELGAIEDAYEPEPFVYEDEFFNYEDEEGSSDDPQLAAVRTQQRRAKAKGKRPMRRLSPEELVRRRDNNLCFNCGETGHLSRACPQKLRPQKSGRRPIRQLNTIELCALGSALTVPVRPPTRRVQTTAVNSGGARGKSPSAHGFSNSVHGKSQSVHGTRTAASGNSNSVRGTRKSKNSAGRRASRSDPQLESTRRADSGTKGLLAALSHGAEIPSPLEPEQTEVVLAGMGVDPLKFTGSVKGKPVTVMIDSGSAGNFISREAAKRLGMAKLPYSSDVSVRLADGSKLPLSWRTPLFQLKMGDHQEEMHLLGLPLQGHEIILGRPWLKK